MSATILATRVRIVGGDDATKDFKWMIQLYLVKRTTDGSIGYRCGATLVHAHVALSAAHCFFDTSGQPMDFDLVASRAYIGLGMFDWHSRKFCTELCKSGNGALADVRCDHLQHTAYIPLSVHVFLMLLQPLCMVHQNCCNTMVAYDTCFGGQVWMLIYE